MQDWLDSPYIRLMRLHQPVGIWLLLWPCWWSYLMVAQAEAKPLVFLLFFLGAVFMRSAGCIINDLIDRELDAKVERTRSRPLASGELEPYQAMILLGVLLAGALAVAAMLGWRVVVWSAIILPMVIAYPMMKRITWWPQLFLGFTFNWGAIVGSIAHDGTLHASAVWLYVGVIFWTLGYDTIYGHQDKADDIKINIRSSSIRLGDTTRKWLYVFYSLTLLLFIAAGLQSAMGIGYFAGLIAVASHLLWQPYRVDLQSPASCRNYFTANVRTGLLMLLTCLAGVYL